MSAKKFREKPVVIEAIRFEKPYRAVQEFCPGIRLIKGGVQGTKVRYALIETLEGNMHADFGDWIIKGVQGEFYSCKPDIFEATYEEVE